MATLDEFSKMRPPLRGAPQAIQFPTPSGYRELHPAVLDLPPLTAKGRSFHRRRWLIGLSVAAALHVGIVLAWFLTPPLRLKASYAPDRWVPVVSIPKPVAPVPVAPQEPLPLPVSVKKKFRHSHSTTHEKTNENKRP